MYCIRGDASSIFSLFWIPGGWAFIEAIIISRFVCVPTKLFAHLFALIVSCWAQTAHADRRKLGRTLAVSPRAHVRSALGAGGSGGVPGVQLLFDFSHVNPLSLAARVVGTTPLAHAAAHAAATSTSCSPPQVLLTRTRRRARRADALVDSASVPACCRT